MMIREIIKSVPVSQRIQHVLVMNLMTVSFIYIILFSLIIIGSSNPINFYSPVPIINSDRMKDSNQPFRSPIEGE